MPHYFSHFVHFISVLNQHFPVLNAPCFYLCRDTMLLAMLTLKLNAVGVPIDIWDVLSDGGDGKMPGYPLL
jgi:hypothetical protein